MRIGSLRALAAAAPLALAACAADPTAVASTQAPILGGVQAQAGQYPTVVAVLINNGFGGLCTGTLVAPDIVLTAAHCVSPAVLGMFDPSLNTQAAVTAATSVAFVQAAMTIPHPGFNANALGDNDIGIIKLVTPVTDRAPTPMNFNHDDAPPGIVVTMVGYGESQAGNQQSAGTEFVLQQKTTVPCAQLPQFGVSDNNVLCWPQTDGTGKCEGDSGGPSFLTISGVVKVVGVTSFGDQNCAMGGIDTRPDAEKDWVISVAPQVQCVADGACAAACGAGGLPEDPDCPTCTDNSMCTDQQVCDMGKCVPAPNTPGGVGTPCTDGSECFTGLCGSGPDGMRCTETCTPGATGECPDGFDCLSAGAAGACWPSPDSGGCGCHAGGASHGGAGALALVGLAMTLVVARRRRAR
jgi:MYXO-CTERM domain-containing protein